MSIMRGSQRGDTLIEVLLALTILAMAITVSIRTMNDGFGRLLVSVQRSEVQALMNGQLAVLRAAHDKAIAGDTVAWERVSTTYAATSTVVSPIAPVGDGCTPLAASTLAWKFYFDTGSLSTDWPLADPMPLGVNYTNNPPKTDGYPKPGDAMWIESIRTDDGNPATRDYVDFYIKACWYSSGGRQEVKSVLRLYDV